MYTHRLAGWRAGLLLWLVIVLSFYVFPLFASSGYVGRTEGELTVTPMGQAVYEIPIPALPGTGGMTPQLSITYNSSSHSGLLGYGFDLTGLSIIGRVPQNIALDGRVGEVTFSSSDRFALDGSRLVPIDTISTQQRVYSTEVKNFARITSYGPEGDPTSFTVQTKDGITYEYQANTRILQPSSTVPGLFWMLTRATDTMGNYYSVSYGGNNSYNEIYPTRIDYTGNSAAGLQPYASIRINYENRPDTAFTYIHGHVVRHLKCVSSIGLYYGESKVREYQMGYTVISSHKLLTSVTEKASNETKNPTLFQWKTSGSLTYSRLETQNIVNLNHVTLHVGDFDGDGRDDFVALPQDNNAPYDGWQLYISGGTYFNNIANGTLEGGNILKEVAVADFDGDGRADFATVSEINSIFSEVCIYRSTGTGFQSPLQLYSDIRNLHIHPLEVNGDRASDLMVTLPNGSYRVYLGQSSSLGNLSMDYAFNGACSQSWDNFIGCDINGDGLTDIINKRSSNSRLMMADGQGGFTELSFGYNTDQCLLFGDFNADGKDDLLYYAYNDTPITSGWPMYASVGTGSFWHLGYIPQPFNPMNVDMHVTDVNCDGYADFITINKTGGGQPCIYLNNCRGGFVAQPAGSSPYASDMWRYYFGDFNGDGKTDMVSTADYENATWTGYDLFLLPTSNNMLLGSVTDGLGNTTTILYKYMSNSSVHTRGNTFNSDIYSFSSTWPVVSQIKTPNGIGGQHSITYNYSNAVMHRKGRGMLGFSEVTATDDATGISTTTTYTPTEGRYIMFPERVETRRGSQMLSEKDITYTISPTGGNSAFMHTPSSVSEKTYEYNTGQVLNYTQSTYSYDTYGNQTYSRVVEGDMTVTTNNTFTNNTTSWILGRLTASTVIKSKAGTSKVCRATFEYDQYSGLLTAETSEPYSNQFGYRKTYIHDAFGNISSSATTPLNTLYAARTNTTTYDTKGRFIASQVNSLGHTVTNHVNESNGLLSYSTDANGIETHYTYDTFGRCETAFTPIDTTITTVGWSSGMVDAPTTALYYTRVEATGKPYSTVFSDCLGRTVRTVTENAFGQKIYTDVVYNSKGQVWKTSEPYFANDTPQWNINTYDDVGRLREQTDAADGTTTYTFEGHATTISDALGHSTTRITDSHGNLVRTIDNDGNTIDYQYDVDGHCINLEGPRTTITMEYDLRGNRKKLTDPDLGVTYSTYNSYGELVSQTDDKGTTTFQYDLLGRLVTETRPDVTVTTLYDTRFIGAVTSTSASNGTSTQYYYDNYGRTTSQQETTGNTTFTVATTYDTQNHPAIITYPNGFSVKYGYSANGLLNSVKNNANQTSIWQLSQQDARGHATQETLGNGLVNENTYDSATGRLTATNTAGIQNWRYNYDVMGNLIERKDVNRNMTENFSYDGLYRLIEVKKNGQVTQQSTYDAVGNLLSRTGVGHEFSYAEGTNRLTSFYAENAYVRPWGEIQYTSFHKVSRIGNGANIMELIYGPDKSRRKITRSGNGSTETKFYVGVLYEQSSGSVLVKTCYIFAGDKAVAIYETKGNTTNMLYLHHDHLGSITAYSDNSGAKVQELCYDAWGRRRDPSTWECYNYAADAEATNPWGFTGHEHIDIFDMVNMDGRMYDPMTGRFLSPDPFMQAPDHTQGLNRYAYCLNNPLSLTDPTGYNWWSDNWKSLLATAVGITVAALTAGTASSASAAIIAGAAGGAAGALTGAVLNGANIDQVAKATLTGAFWGGVSGFFNFASADELLLAKIYKHTFSQGWLEGIQGGNMFHGMMMGAVSGVGGHYIDKYHDTLGKVGEITTSAVLGGTIDELGGGKFANGAITSAYSVMFNDMMHPQSEDSNAFVLDDNSVYQKDKPLKIYPIEFDLFFVGRSLFTGAAKSVFSLFSSKSSFSTIEDVLSKATYVKKLKHGEIQSVIKAKNMDKVFYNLASRNRAPVRTTSNGNPYFEVKGYRVTLYTSSNGAGRTMGINTGQQIHKIRLKDNLIK